MNYDSIIKDAGNKDCKRAMYVNHYVKQQMDLFASAETDVTWGFRKANPFEQLGRYNEALGMSQLEYMEENGFLILIGKGDGYKKYIEPFEKKNPLLIYSMWDGQLDPKRPAYNEKLAIFCQKYNAIIKHTSGHAYPELIEQVINKVNPTQRIWPIHTENVKGFLDLNISDELKGKVRADG